MDGLPGALGAPVLHAALTGAVAGFVVSVVLTPLVGRLALSSGAVDLPGARKVHDRPLPRLGGAAIYLAFWIAVALVSGNLPVGQAERTLLAGFALGSMLLLAVGVFDDHVDAPKWLRFLFQGLAAEIAWRAGFRLTLGRWLLAGRLSEVTLSSGEHALTVLWIMGLANALNFIDGLDFLCAGTSMVSVTALAGIAVASATPAFLPQYAVLAAVLAGFGIYNRHPTSIFLGDSGSTFLGYFLACFSCYQGAQGPAGVGAPVLPIVLLAVPVGDTLYAIARRLWLRVSPFSGDRGHLHHRLLALGCDQRRAVRVLCGTSFWLGLAAVGFSIAGPGWTAVLLVVVIAGLIVAARKLSLLDPDVIRAGRCHDHLHRATDPVSRSDTPRA